MESLFSSTTFKPEFIFGNLVGDIVDYVISSYTVNINLIKLYYWHKALQVHCGVAYGGIPQDNKYITIHRIQEPGIYHAKFVIITTEKMFRLIVMTTNITNQLVQHCWNDYYILNLPRVASPVKNVNTERLSLFLKHYNIKLTLNPSLYDWSNVRGTLTVSIPNVISHTNCWRHIFNNNDPNGIATIQTTTGMLNYNIAESLGVTRCLFKYPKDFKERKTSDLNYFLLDLSNTKNFYHLKEIDTEIPYHFKRYHITTDSPRNKWFILTSANLSLQAWGSINRAAKNTELGVIWKLN